MCFHGGGDDDVKEQSTARKRLTDAVQDGGESDPPPASRSFHWFGSCRSGPDVQPRGDDKSRTYWLLRTSARLLDWLNTGAPPEPPSTGQAGAW